MLLNCCLKTLEDVLVNFDVSLFLAPTSSKQRLLHLHNSDQLTRRQNGKKEVIQGTNIIRVYEKTN